MNEPGSFGGVVQHLKANKGIFVTNTGFSESAVQFANAEGIALAIIKREDRELKPGVISDAIARARRAWIQAQNLVVQEGERSVGFFQTGQSILLGLGNVLQEAAHITVRKVARMPFGVEENQTARPVGEAFAGTVLAEARSGGLADEVEKGQLGRQRSGERLRGHGLLPNDKMSVVEECTSIQMRRQGKKRSGLDIVKLRVFNALGCGSEREGCYRALSHLMSGNIRARRALEFGRVAPALPRARIRTPVLWAKSVNCSVSGSCVIWVE